MIDQRVEALVAERLDTLVKERVAQALKRDPARHDPDGDKNDERHVRQTQRRLNS